MVSDRQYWYPPDYTHPISADSLHEAEPEFQKEVMRAWFFQHYEDPVESTPYDSSEGGYIYVWGGPYDAGEELSGEFSDSVQEEVIKELADELARESPEWSGKPSAGDIDESYISAITSNTEFHRTLLENIENIQALLYTGVDNKLQQQLLRLLYVNVVTALETFLSDAFINKVIRNQTLLQKFVETNPDFQGKKLVLSQIFCRMKDLDKEVKSYLVDLVWHNLEKVKPMYKSTLGIDFPKDLRRLFKAIAIRHDIVHRNGKNKEGNEIQLSRADVEQLLADVRDFGLFVDDQFEESAL
jgi:hypothetical protein